MASPSNYPGNIKLKLNTTVAQSWYDKTDVLTNINHTFRDSQELSISDINTSVTSLGLVVFASAELALDRQAMPP